MGSLEKEKKHLTEGENDTLTSLLITLEAKSADDEAVLYHDIKMSNPYITSHIPLRQSQGPCLQLRKGNKSTYQPHIRLSFN